MTTFDNRENAFENKFAHDADLHFKITARRNKLVGHWAAEKMGLTPEETTSYATSVVQADFEEAGDEDVVRKLLGDLTSAGVDVDDAMIRAALEEKMVEARRQFSGNAPDLVRPVCRKTRPIRHYSIRIWRWQPSDPRGHFGARQPMPGAGVRD